MAANGLGGIGSGVDDNRYSPPKGRNIAELETGGNLKGARKTAVKAVLMRLFQTVFTALSICRSRGYEDYG
jgi:hypothetical protein